MADTGNGRSGASGSRQPEARYHEAPGPIGPKCAPSDGAGSAASSPEPDKKFNPYEFQVATPPPGWLEAAWAVRASRRQALGEQEHLTQCAEREPATASGSVPADGAWTCQDSASVAAGSAAREAADGDHVATDRATSACVTSLEHELPENPSSTPPPAAPNRHAEQLAQPGPEATTAAGRTRSRWLVASLIVVAGLVFGYVLLHGRLPVSPVVDPPASGAQPGPAVSEQQDRSGTQAQQPHPSSSAARTAPAGPALPAEQYAAHRIDPHAAASAPTRQKPPGGADLSQETSRSSSAHRGRSAERSQSGQQAAPRGAAGRASPKPKATTKAPAEPAGAKSREPAAGSQEDSPYAPTYQH